MRERGLDGGLRDLREGDPPLLGGRDLRGLRDMPCDGLALPVEVGREEHGVRAARGLADARDLAPAVLADHVLGGEVVLHVNAEPALAGVLGEVADMALRGEDRVVLPEVALDRLGLRGALDDHQVPAHRPGV